MPERDKASVEPQQNLKGKLDPVLRFGLGGISGLVAAVTTQPLDVVKTRMQYMQAGAYMGTSVDLASAGGRQGYTTVWAALKQIHRDEGLRGLWAGSVPTSFRVGLGAGLYFSCLEASLGFLEHHRMKPRDKLSADETFAAGFMARLVAAVITNPMSVLKTRFEGERVRHALQGAGAGSLRHRGFVTTLVEIARVEKASGLLSGIVPTVCRDAPFSGLYFAAYSQLRPALDSSLTDLHPRTATTASSILAAAAAGISATLIVHPADVVKTRMQMPAPTGFGPPPRRKIWQLIGSILKTDGARGLFVGVVPRILKRMPQQAITWTCYDFAQREFAPR